MISAIKQAIRQFIKYGRIRLREIIYYNLEIEKYSVLTRVIKKIILPPVRSYTSGYAYNEPCSLDYIGAPTLSCNPNGAYLVATYPVREYLQKNNLAFIYFYPRYITYWGSRRFLSSPSHGKSFYVLFEDYIHSSATIQNVVLYDHDIFLKKNYSFDAENGDIYIFWMHLPCFIEKMAKKNPHLQKKLFVWNMEQLTDPLYQKHARIYAKLRYPKVLTHSPSNLRFLPPGTIYLPYRYNPREVAKLRSYLVSAFKYDVVFVGEMTPRRADLIRDLQARGIKTAQVTCTFGDACDALVAEAKILLNIQFKKDSKIYPHIRCDRWIFAGKLIVSEECLDWDQLDIHHNVIFAPYEQLVDKIEEVLAAFEHFQREYTNNDLNKIAQERERHWHRFIEQCRP